jgi:hypothetical protein
VQRIDVLKTDENTYHIHNWQHTRMGEGRTAGDEAGIILEQA